VFWDAVFIQNAEIVPYNLYNVFYGNENDLIMVCFIPPMTNKMPSNGGSVLPKTSSSEEIEVAKLSSPLKEFRVHFFV